MRLVGPGAEDLVAAADLMMARIATLEAALVRVAELGRVGTWPSWEMRWIAEQALGKAP